MSRHVHHIDGQQHVAFLAQQRRDPYTKELIRVGDRVVICASCKSAFLEDSWLLMGERHCNQASTLAVIQFDEFRNQPHNHTSPIRFGGQGTGTLQSRIAYNRRRFPSAALAITTLAFFTILIALIVGVYLVKQTRQDIASSSPVKPVPSGTILASPSPNLQSKVSATPITKPDHTLDNPLQPPSTVTPQAVLSGTPKSTPNAVNQPSPTLSQANTIPARSTAAPPASTTVSAQDAQAPSIQIPIPSATPKLSPPTPTPAITPKPYSGPLSGSISWNGVLEENSQIDLGNQLPGVPVLIVSVEPQCCVNASGRPSPTNQWKKLIITSTKKINGGITVRWRVL